MISLVLRQSKLEQRLICTNPPKALKYDPQIQDYLRAASKINSPKQYLDSLFRLKCEEREVGILTDEIVTQLSQYPEVFELNDQARCVEVNPSLTDFEIRTEAIAKVMDSLRYKSVIPPNTWRNELFPVADRFNSEPCFLVVASCRYNSLNVYPSKVERAAIVTLGIKAYGINVNGYVVDNDRIYLWVSKRSDTKPMWPSMLDQIVAGGQPHGIGLMENLVKECEEEAGIPEELAKKAKPVGAVSYIFSKGVEVQNVVLFVCDLQLPKDFTPRAKDSEVDWFTLMPIDEVAEFVRKPDIYRPDSALVVVDFLIRHGYVTPDQNGYLDLLCALREGRLL